MAAENRQNLATTLAALSAVVDLSELKAVLTNFIDSMAMNRDVQNTITVAGAGTTNVNFGGYDTIYVSTSYSCTLNIQNINDGEVKFLHVNKSAGIDVIFTGATEQSLDHAYVTFMLTDVVYMVYKKHLSTVVVIPMVKDLDISSYYTKVESDGKYAIPTDLGDKTDWDFELSDFTIDNSWHDLNLSSVIPTNAKFIFCRVKTKIFQSVEIYTKKYGNSNEYNITKLSSDSGSALIGIIEENDVWIPVNNQKISYKLNDSNGTFTELFFLVKMWI